MILRLGLGRVQRLLGLIGCSVSFVVGVFMDNHSSRIGSFHGLGLVRYVFAVPEVILAALIVGFIFTPWLSPTSVVTQLVVPKLTGVELGREMSRLFPHPMVKSKFSRVSSYGFDGRVTNVTENTTPGDLSWEERRQENLATGANMLYLIWLIPIFGVAAIRRALKRGRKSCRFFAVGCGLLGLLGSIMAWFAAERLKIVAPDFGVYATMLASALIIWSSLLFGRTSDVPPFREYFGFDSHALNSVEDSRHSDVNGTSIGAPPLSRVLPNLGTVSAASSQCVDLLSAAHRKVKDQPELCVVGAFFLGLAGCYWPWVGMFTVGSAVVVGLISTLDRSANHVPKDYSTERSQSGSRATTWNTSEESTADRGHASL